MATPCYCAYTSHFGSYALESTREATRRSRQTQTRLQPLTRWCRQLRRRASPSVLQYHTRRCEQALGEKRCRPLTMILRVHRDIDVLTIVLIIVQIEPTVLVHALLLRSHSQTVCHQKGYRVRERGLRERFSQITVLTHFFPVNAFDMNFVVLQD